MPLKIGLEMIDKLLPPLLRVTRFCETSLEVNQALFLKQPVELSFVQISHPIKLVCN